MPAILGFQTEDEEETAAGNTAAVKGRGRGWSRGRSRGRGRGWGRDRESRNDKEGIFQ